MLSVEPDHISSSEVVSRALSFVGEGIYKLGGGALHTDESPFGFTKNQFPGTCDCSGFTAWCARYKRGPWNTDAMVRDATKGGRRFRLVSRDELVRPADFLVYPGPDRDHDGERDAPGHVGIIVRVLDGFVRGRAEWWEHLEVAHCTPRAQRTQGAIKLTDATLWAGRGYIVRATHVEYL
jgi:hypothetical protein